MYTVRIHCAVERRIKCDLVAELLVERFSVLEEQHCTSTRHVR